MDLSLPRGVKWRNRARNVSMQVLQTRLAVDRGDAVASETQVMEAVNDLAWNPGDILNVEAPIPSKLNKKMSKWLRGLGLLSPDGGPKGSVHACEGSWFHEDGYAFGDKFFCVTWLGESEPWDLVFPQSKIRIPLLMGTTVLFDSANVHGVVGRDTSSFSVEALGQSGVQTFCSRSLNSSPLVMELFQSTWHPLKNATLNLDWASGICPQTGKLLNN